MAGVRLSPYLLESNRKIFGILLLLASLLLSGCFYNDDPPPTSATGKQMYTEYCASCHKANGLGKFLMGIPANAAHRLSRAEVIKLIREGDPRYPRMPVFPQIKFSQADKIAHYLTELKEQQ
ncbi:c-type cytochrome [Oceanospirillum sp.]|uniref:c-type cytochrome n=1 Tax=Oceanospirillum sp. TaxID=2021254 RepID=UPI003A90491E